MSFKAILSTKNRHRTALRIGGFTLIELMVALAVAIILAAVGVPQYYSFMQTQKVLGEATSLYNDMQFARAEAMKEGQTVSLCISSDSATCTGSNWNQGWIVFSNPTSATTFSATNSTLLKAQVKFATSDTVVPLPAATSLVSFNRNGFAIGVSSATGLLLQVRTNPLNTENLAATRCLWISSIGNQYIQTVNSSLATGQGTACS